MAAAAAFVWNRYERAGPLAQPVNVVIPRGAGITQVADLLAGRGVIASPLIFRIGTMVDGQGSQLKAGEFAFAPAISARDAAAVIAGGRTVVRRITLPEGITTAQAVALLRAAEGFEGEIAAAPAEGALLPDTYHYSWGDQRGKMLERQRRAMSDALAELWDKRAPDLPLKTPEEAVILASIVEKETGVPEERPRIAIAAPGRSGGALRVDARFGLHPRLAALKPAFDAGELAFVHAVGMPAPTRSRPRAFA